LIVDPPPVRRINDRSRRYFLSRRQARLVVEATAADVALLKNQRARAVVFDPDLKLVIAKLDEGVSKDRNNHRDSPAEG